MVFNLLYPLFNELLNTTLGEKYCHDFANAWTPIPQRIMENGHVQAYLPNNGVAVELARKAVHDFRPIAPLGA